MFGNNSKKIVLNKEDVTMSNISEKVSYLKGLSEGMKISDATNEGKLLLAVLDALEEISYELESLEEFQDELDERVSEIDEDLGCLEEDVYGKCCNGGSCDCDDDCDCGCQDDCCEKPQYITVECPHCKKETSFDLSIFDENTESVECPNCHEKIEVVYQED